MRPVHAFVCALALLVASAAGVPAKAQSYPTQPVKIMVQQGPGGSLDIALRILAEHLSPILGQQVVVLNQPGAGGLIAARALASAPPDGYTLFMAASSVFVSLPELQSNLPFDVSEFVPIGYIGEQPFAMGVTASMPVNSLAELIELSKKSPDGLNTVAGTLGGLQHMSLEWFRARSNAKLTMVHYPTTAAALNDVMAGRVPVVWDFAHEPRRHRGCRPHQAPRSDLSEAPGAVSAAPARVRYHPRIRGLGLAYVGRAQGPAAGHRTKTAQRSPHGPRAPGAAEEIRRPRDLPASDVVAGARRLHSQRAGTVAADRTTDQRRETVGLGVGLTAIRRSHSAWQVR